MMIKTTAIFVGEILLILAIAGAAIYCIVGMLKCCKKCMAKKGVEENKESSSSEYDKIQEELKNEENKTKKTEITDRYTIKEDGRAFSEIVDFFKDEKDEKIRKTKEFFETFLGKEVEVRYYIHDPRGANLDVYTEMNEESINKVISEFKIKNVYECEFESIKYIEIQTAHPMNKVCFTMHLIDKDHINEIIEKDYECDLIRSKLDQFRIY